MKKFDSISRFQLDEPEARPFARQSTNLAARKIVALLLGEGPLARNRIQEASVHRSRRSKVFVATYTGPAGGQVWKTTGLTDYQQALLLARHWETEAREQRDKLRRTAPKQSPRVRQGQGGGRTGRFTQKEVAQILKMSERGVRAIERRALQKLRNHPLLKQLWRQYLSGELDENTWALDPAEIEALFDLAWTFEELRLVEKLLSIVQCEFRQGV